MLTRARQELRDTDLFKSVSFQTGRQENGDLVLHILLEERKYWLLLPRISRNSEGDVKTGFRLRMYNLRGADQTLEMLAQQEKEGTGDDSDEFRFKYYLPMISKPYFLRWRVSHIVKNTKVDDFDNVETTRLFSMGVSRDWHIETFEIPLTVAASASFEDRELDRPYPDTIDAVEAGKYNRLKLALTFDDVHSEKYRRFGSSYTISISRGFKWLGSDYDTDELRFEGIGFRPLNRYDNINYRLAFAVSNDSPFDYANYDIGGGSSLRGLESFDERGDALVFTNLEYIFAYREKPGLRHSLFVDLGNVYDELNEINLHDLHYTIGTGFRWKIQSFVKTDLFLDYGYDIEDEAGKLYGGTSLNF